MARRSKNDPGAQVLPIDRSASAGALAPSGGAIVGWLVRFTAEEGPVVDYPGNPHGPLPARTVVTFDPGSAAAAIAERRGVVMLLERGRDDSPIVMGLLAPTMPVQAELPAPPDDVRVDGRRVEIEGADEIVLRCGQASIVLRRNGRVLIRGTAVETRARGVNRIKGGSVQIN